MVMVKAFAYGGGSLEIANLLQYHKIDYLGVAYLDEAVDLRNNGIKTPIMVMNPDLKNLEEFCRYKIEPEIYNMACIKAIVALDEPPPIHIKIDTGMNRLGFEEEGLTKLLNSNKFSKLNIVGVFTHFSSADDPAEDEFTHLQAAKFEMCYDQITSRLNYDPIKCAVNSVGIIRFPDYHYDMVRLGIGLYGFDPTLQLHLRPVSKLITHISQIKKVKAGESIGYGRSGRANNDLIIAIVPVGYADGYLRIFGNGTGKMNVKGQLAPTIGNICMDMTMLDVTGTSVEEGEEVIVFGDNPTIQDLAIWARTIPYEILTNISQRVNRVYKAR
jgi:alanine racemase